MKEEGRKHSRDKAAECHLGLAIERMKWKPGDMDQKAADPGWV